VAIAGFGLVFAAAAANQAWLDRHFLPSFFVPRHWYVRIEYSVRIAIAVTGIGLVLGRSRVIRWLTHAPLTALSVAVAAVLAVVSAEFTVRWIRARPTEWLLVDEEPRRQEDDRLGWVLAPARTGHALVSSRAIDYAIDRNGYRVRQVDEPVDRERPTIVFGGESVMFGEGLTWEESIPAQVGDLMRMQSANLAVHGYSTDQMYLRLAREVPRFRHPVAIVAIFMTELFGRNLDDDRPHLAPGLHWLPAEHGSRVMALAGLLVPYRRDTTVERGIELTRDALRAIVQLARSRGATAVVVVPTFGAEDAVQNALQARIFTDEIPRLVVQLDPDWRLRWDRHPNARAAHVIAEAVADRLGRNSSGVTRLETR
jgi:hypothetical protein